MKYIISLLLTLIGCATPKTRPIELPDFRATAVKLVKTDRSGGGSGVIYQSINQSLILTNRHVCRGLQEGGIAEGSQVFALQAYKMSKLHDLCLIAVAGNYKVNTIIAETPPKLYDEVKISGFPELNPHSISSGHLSDIIKVVVAIDQRNCTIAEFLINPIQCLMEGMPVTSMVDGQYTTVLIAPGSSGSGVFSKSGELVGLAFAISTDTSLPYAFIVPAGHLKHFIDTEVASLEWQTFPVVVDPIRASCTMDIPFRPAPSVSTPFKGN